MKVSAKTVITVLIVIVVTGLLVWLTLYLLGQKNEPFLDLYYPHFVDTGLSFDPTTCSNDEGVYMDNFRHLANAELDYYEQRTTCTN